MLRQQLEEDAINGFEKLYNIITGRSFTKLSEKPKHVNAINQITLKFNDNTFLKLEKIIGEGFWSFVFLVKDCNDGTNEPVIRALKVLRPSHPDILRNSIHSLGGLVINHKKQCIKEAAIYKSYCNYGEVLIRTVNDLEISALVMPYLGTTSVTKLIADTFYLSHIPLEEWLIFLKDCVTETLRFHRTTECQHYDIKPSNIITTPVQIEGATTWKLVNTTLCDPGNARKISEIGPVGDLRYVPFIKSMLGMFISMNDTTVDQYALGKSLLDVIEVLKNLKSFQHPQVKEVLRQCHANAKSLISQISPSSLEKVAREFEIIQANYAIAEKCPLIMLSTELERLRAKLDIQVKVPVHCCIHATENFHTFFKKSPPIPIKHSIQAIDKLLDLIAEKDVEFSEQDIQAYKVGELGDIVTHFRLERNLPRNFDMIERRSFSVDLGKRIMSLPI